MFKDSIITAKDKTREVIIFLVCFVAAFLVNVGAIIAYRGPWTEIFTQIGFVVIIAAVIYLLHWLVRLAVMVIRHFFGK